MCVYAWGDFANAVVDLSCAKREGYENKINNLFTINAKFIMKLPSSIARRVNTGVAIPDSTVDSVQSFVDSFACDVAELRSMAKKWEYIKYKKEITRMADTLEKLYKSTNVRMLYKEAINAKLKESVFPFLISAVQRQPQHV